MDPIGVPKSDSPRRGQRTPFLLRGEKVLRYEADEGSLSPTSALGKKFMLPKETADKRWGIVSGDQRGGGMCGLLVTPPHSSLLKVGAHGDAPGRFANRPYEPRMASAHLRARQSPSLQSGLWWRKNRGQTPGFSGIVPAMARLSRVNVVAVAHHATLRGNGRAYILASGSEQAVYLSGAWRLSPGSGGKK
jgi:hypothetical protein